MRFSLILVVVVAITIFNVLGSCSFACASSSSVHHHGKPRGSGGSSSTLSPSPQAQPYSQPKPRGATATATATPNSAALSVNINAIFADNERRRTILPAGWRKKIEKLSTDAYSFFRGTTPQFYRRLFQSTTFKQIKDAPMVIAHGDLHMENFGMVSDDKGALTYGIDDFDENFNGPSSIDIVRCLASMQIAWGKDSTAADIDRYMQSFVQGYLKGLDGKIQIKSKVVNDFVSKQMKLKNTDMLKDRTVVVGKQRKMKIDPLKGFEVSAAAKARIGQSLVSSIKSWGNKFSKLSFMDSYHRFGGTASIDLYRFESVLGNGDNEDVILEMKEMLPSVLSFGISQIGVSSDPILSKGKNANEGNFLRIQRGSHAWQGRSAALPMATSTFTSDQGQTYPMLIRIRPHYKGAIAPVEVKAKDREEYVNDLGKITGVGHVRSVAFLQNAKTTPQQLQQYVSMHTLQLIDAAKEQAKFALADFQTFSAKAKSMLK